MKSTSSYVPQVRLLPSVIVCATVLLGLKLVGLSVDMEALLDPVPSAYAEAAEDMENGEAGAESATMSDPATRRKLPQSLTAKRLRDRPHRLSILRFLLQILIRLLRQSKTCCAVSVNGGRNWMRANAKFNFKGACLRRQSGAFSLVLKN